MRRKKPNTNENNEKKQKNNMNKKKNCFGIARVFLISRGQRRPRIRNTKPRNQSK